MLRCTYYCVSVVTSDLASTCVALSRLSKKPNVPLLAKAWQFSKYSSFQAHIKVLIAKCPNNDDGITTNYEKNVEICSPDIWINNIGLNFSIPELLRSDLVEFQSLLASHTSLNKPIMPFDKTWDSRCSERKGYHQGYSLKHQFFIKKYRLYGHAEFYIVLKIGLHVFQNVISYQLC
jgi:hypothetical protein